MKKTNAQELRLGLLVILSTLLFIVAVYLVGQKQNLFKKSFTISSYFQNVNGLQKGNNVRYSGVDIGMVQAIEMVNDSVIQVTMKIDEKIITHINKNALATIGSDGLVGNMIVNIIPGEGTAERIQNGDVIQSFSRIGGDDILSTLNATSDNLAILISNMMKVTNKLNHGEGTLGVLLNDTLMAQNLKSVSYNLKLASWEASKSVKELNVLINSMHTNKETLLGVLLNDTLSGQTFRNTITNLENTSSQLETIAVNIDQLVTEIRTSEGTFNYIMNDTALVKSLQSTMKNINEGTAKFNEDMEALKHNFLFRGYFKKLEKEEAKAKKRNP